MMLLFSSVHGSFSYREKIKNMVKSGYNVRAVDQRSLAMANGYNRQVIFSLGDMVFEYDEEKNLKNIKKHGLPLSIGARVFFDDFRIELDDTLHGEVEQRYDVIGNAIAGMGYTDNDEILFVVYTERETITEEGVGIEVTRLISVRLASNFERGVYYANRR